MDSKPFRRRRALALPLGLALTASLFAFPGASTALAQAPSTTKSGEKLSYVVNTDTDDETIERVRREISAADGTVISAHEKIGVLVAHSQNPEFGATMRAVEGVDSAGATRTAPLTAASSTDVGKPEYLKNPKAVAEKLARSKGADALRGGGARTEPLESLQWNIPAIKADKAHKVSEGSKKVTVAVIDTGVDDTHPDLKPNFSERQSASCVGGTADTSPGAWRPYAEGGSYHGTHVAGTIAAPRNGVGVTGVAPGVQVSSIKVSEQHSSLFYAEAVVCAFTFAAEHGVEITNNSYYVDPWLFNCPDQADQAAIADAVGRAAKYAERKGVLNVSSAGNSSHDLAADEITDDTSPNDTTPVTRTVDPAECVDLPTQLPGSVTVSATGAQPLKSYYSNYGEGVIDVAAPGGDKYQIPGGDAKDGRILSTMPDGEYAFLQGTSMAGPHVAGVAALIKSEHRRSTPQELQWRMKAWADNPGCPTEPYDPEGDGEVNAECAGHQKVNSFYGYGIVDALDAVRK
ncbi:S8 family serine peptidase [Streptomyces sp. N2-109]|uniref:S8 family serine peptidase n=1 Tax=Streptomyces gossypii TaxID=2883101 RepID=A0ABT2K2A8_9ACTN|nr:S8 family serine peptidase [Streptomyces gossypii]MCT2593764.1 S8 family serine peptidase [Streptomyces gossypii]